MDAVENNMIKWYNEVNIIVTFFNKEPKNYMVYLLLRSGLDEED